MEIKIDVSNVNLDSEIGDEIVDIDEDGNVIKTTGHTLRQLVAQHIFTDLKRETRYNQMRELVNTIRTEEIRKLVQAQVTEAMDAPFRRTNSYGEPTGETVTMRTLVLDEARKFFTEKTGDYNQPKFSGADRAIGAAVKDVMQKELADLVKAEKAKTIAALQGNVAKVLTQAVEQGLRA